MQSTRALGLSSRLISRSFAQPTGMRMVRAATTTTKMTQAENLELLNKQRSLRPSSPHFTIYQPQMTWIPSIFNRITGTGLSALMYVWACSYVAAPHLGFVDTLSSAHLVDLAATLPVWIKTGLKIPLAAAFSFHSYNGIRHLAWDWGYFLSLKGVYSSGYAVLAATAATTLGLVML